MDEKRDMRIRLQRILAVGTVVLTLSGGVPSAHAAADHWIATWAGPAQQTARVFAPETTLREVVWATVGGEGVRVKLSNALGSDSVTIGAASVGLKGIDASVILADGINDLGGTASNPSLAPHPADIAYGLRQLVERAHARGVKVIGTTMGPAWGFRGYEAIEFKRLAFNEWMRTEGIEILDGLVDFDEVLRDPNDPSRMNPLYDTDGIHPNNAGHKAMADAVDLELLR